MEGAAPTLACVTFSSPPPSQISSPKYFPRCFSSPDLIVFSVKRNAPQKGNADSEVFRYGVSKAGANYFVRKVHFEQAGVIAVAVHPG
jgi:norsolorinic acid ketoreductase